MSPSIERAKRLLPLLHSSLTGPLPRWKGRLSRASPRCAPNARDSWSAALRHRPLAIQRLWRRRRRKVGQPRRILWPQARGM